MELTERELREKVVAGLAACMPQTEADAATSCSGGCPYFENPCCGDYQDNDHVNLPIRMIEDVRKLLKAQEAVKPIECNGFYYCGTCRHAFIVNRQKYCTDCGKAVKWE